MNSQFRHLFSPIEIGGITVRNRIFTTAHGTALGEGSMPSERHVRYHAERAKGGIGMIIMEATRVHPTCPVSGHRMHLWDDTVIPRFRKVADAVHEHGAKILVQLFHRGRRVDALSYEVPGWAPSPVRWEDPVPGEPTEIAHEMTLDDIDELVRAFGEGARRAKEAGIDGVEVHAGQGFLLQQFLSPHSNFRSDDYGGSLANRLRFTLEIIDSIRSRVGDDFVLGLRISGDEFVDDGLSLEDMREVAARLEATGKVDFLNVTVGTDSNFFAKSMHISPMYVPLANHIYLAAAIKEVVASRCSGTGG